MKENIPLYKDEEIKPIVGYEDLYSITSFGRVWSHEKIRQCGNRVVKRKARFLKSFILNKNNKNTLYFRVKLCDYGEKKSFLVHRLVAQAYIPNPQNLPEVNHKDGIKSNCRKDNLEWCTDQDNQNHAMVNKLRKKRHSKYYGVTLDKRKKSKYKPWVAAVKVNKRRFHIGYFKTEIEAAQAYNDYVIEHNLNRPLNKIDEILKSQVK